MRAYLAHLWQALIGRITPRIKTLEARLSAFEQKAQKDFQTRSNAQKGRKKNTGAAQQ